jgi:enamine deaminase RidA (YjgF/YER057c/UK114 family)
MNEPHMIHPLEAIRFSANSTDEVFFAFHSTPRGQFAAEAEAMMAKYAALQEDRGCSIDTEVMLRFHLSDIATQAPVLRQFLGERNAFVTMTGQPPVGGAAIAIEAHHIRTSGALTKTRTDCNGSHQLDVALSNYQQLYHCRREFDSGDSAVQTARECRELNAAVTARKGTIEANCLRTWFYAHDIDNTYAGVVKARREYFDTKGLTRDAHYIASTGIGGACEDAERIVGMDSLSVFGIEPEQVEFMHALDHMPPTHVYNVTFERGTRVLYGDRSHYYISGTASIDAEGEIMHPGDVRAQAHRMAKNVDVLLRNHGASFDDMQLAVVYIRNMSDAAAVTEEIDTLFPVNLPRIIVNAQVCRPGWLLEMDGIAVNRHGNESFPNFA